MSEETASLASSKMRRKIFYNKMLAMKAARSRSAKNQSALQMRIHL
ncbi:MAG TPA: hypothetical protein VFC85_03945 [Verrucomicrobiae bacterium]|nr:hypothetical protein [Verrucomicrobiae bacterium]